MPKIQIVSDLHIEYKNDKLVEPLDYITPSAEYLLLVGDIGSLYKEYQLEYFLKGICKHYKHVFYVLGNHEFYIQKEYKHQDMQALKSIIYNIKAKIPNLFILDKKSVIIGNTCITGCTLWSELDYDIDIPKFIVKISGITTRKYNDMYNEDLNYIQHMINFCKDKKYKLIVATHYPPSYKVLEGVQKRQRYISLYANHLDYLLDKSKIFTWIFGHTHKNHDFVSENGTRIISNQLGKGNDCDITYKKDFTIDL